MTESLIIAIDGSAGSGKSTLAAALAERLGLATLDTGSTYRAMTAAVLNEDLDPANNAATAAFAQAAAIDDLDGTVINAVNYSDELRTAEVNSAVSLVAANPLVRQVLVSWQRSWVALRRGGIVEGRDIGTVVFPDATVKVFLTARSSERARRRPEEGLASIERRDELDSKRESSPLARADDAMEIDTTDRPVSDIVDLVVASIPKQIHGD
jgi:cytidylate kinase